MRVPESLWEFLCFLDAKGAEGGAWVDGVAALDHVACGLPSLDAGAGGDAARPGARLRQDPLRLAQHDLRAIEVMIEPDADKDGIDAEAFSELVADPEALGHGAKAEGVGAAGCGGLLGRIAVAFLDVLDEIVAAIAG